METHLVSGGAVALLCCYWIVRLWVRQLWLALLCIAMPKVLPTQRAWLLGLPSDGAVQVSEMFPLQPSVLSMLNRCRAISRKPFFTGLTRTLEQAKIHKQTCKWQSRPHAPESSNTSCFFAPLLFLFLSYFFLSCLSR